MLHTNTFMFRYALVFSTEESTFDFIRLQLKRQSRSYSSAVGC